MIDKKSWEEFRETGLLCFVNSILHVFGWAICFDYEDGEDSKLKEVFPARCKFRGFSEKSVSKSHKDIAKYLKENIDDLTEEANN